MALIRFRGVGVGDPRSYTLVSEKILGWESVNSYYPSTKVYLEGGENVVIPVYIIDFEKEYNLAVNGETNG